MTRKDKPHRTSVVHRNGVALVAPREPLSLDPDWTMVGGHTLPSRAVRQHLALMEQDIVARDERGDIAPWAATAVVYQLRDLLRSRGERSTWPAVRGLVSAARVVRERGRDRTGAGFASEDERDYEALIAAADELAAGPEPVDLDPATDLGVLPS